MMNNREKLYEKMNKELQDYLKEIKEMDKETIINSAYEIAVKTDIVDYFYSELNEFSEDEIEFLLKEKYPLNWSYKTYLQNDFNPSEVLSESIHYTILNYKGKQKNIDERGER